MVTINCPLHKGTRGLFDQAMLTNMKQGAYLVNTARGAIVDRDALVQVLESGHLAGPPQLALPEALSPLRLLHSSSCMPCNVTAPDHCVRGLTRLTLCTAAC